ncbi:zinc finger BED domain-containing protein 4-like [Neoarius graeffei]|uniref:zinc finger BED domain-containing protein 4-like n=1 Tax=Neoarius graeffei TaxID=443677 RepID=UPI00298BD41F|nr:zinc finger BED domain-containing protein 4-like [Neoarius graeffei]
MPYEKTSKRHKDITHAITHFIAKGMLPIRTVETAEFKQLMNVIDPRYQLPGHKHFSQTAIPNMYTECRGMVERDLQAVSYFATTSDMWSSRTSEPYMSLTAHYIEQDWTLKSKCLQTAYFPKDHTERTGKNKKVERAVGVCKKAVAAFSFSWKKKRDLAAAQEELHLPQHKLVTESPTRWGSRQKMVERMLEQQEAIAQVLGADKKTRQLVPAWQEIEVLESVHGALNTLLEFTDSLSSENYVSVSYLKPMLQLFRTQILKPADDETQLTKELKMTVMSYLDEKYTDPITEELLDIATLVDPHFKVQYINPENIDAIKMRAVSEMLEDLSTSVRTEEAAPEQAEAGDAAVPPPLKKQKKSLGSFFKKSHSSPELNDRERVESELENYLMAADADSETDPLQWWKINERNFPRLSCLAKRYLCIPATSTPSERVFSTGGNIVTCHRAALKPETVDRLVFLACNL